MSEVYCRIWGLERSHLNGTAHYCHAKRMGLEGSIYSKNQVAQKLKKTPTQCNPEEYEWTLRTCEPSLDPRNVSQCEGCQFKIFMGHKEGWGIK